MSTRSLARQTNNALPPSRRPGFMSADMRQQRHQHSMVRLSRCITQLENEVHQAMAVMDADTGKLLNYRQLTRSMKYREAWSISSANEFGRLANGIGGGIKNSTNTIEFIFQHVVPTERMKEVTLGNSCARCDQKRQKHGSLQGGTESTTQAQSPPQQQKCWWQKCSSTA